LTFIKSIFAFKKQRKLSFVLQLFFVFNYSNVIGQVVLDYPKNRMVVQRNAQNTADIYLEGSFVGNADKIEARLITLSNAGVPVTPLEVSDWQVIAACPLSNNFSGALFNKQAGWYNLEVKATNLGIEVGPITRIKIGIGEVFVISGQSNATGLIPLKDPTVYAPVDDRVNCINLLDNTSLPAPEMEFSHLESYSNIAPQGVTAWCWGVFGQAIATNWNVPVALFNTAIGNTSIFVWRAAANGEMDPCGTNVETCMPYYYLKKTLTNYIQKTGIRAVLWQQGENDLGNFEGGGFPPEYYSQNLKQIIDKSRSNYDGNLSWIIAKASRVGDNVSARVTNGQQIIIDSLNYNTFKGPEADNIQPSANERDTFGVHFWGQGLTDLGNSWFDSVNSSNFIANSKPQLGRFKVIGTNAIKSGNWDDPTVWSNGKIPTLNDDVIICNGFKINLNSIAHLKSLNLHGELNFNLGASLQFNE
jgi:hypothetical protein